MSDTKNQRAGRQKELRAKMRKMLERWKAVFDKDLSVADLKEYLHHAAKQERFQFLHDRLGFLSEVDAKYLLEILDEKQIAPELPAKVVDELEELELNDPLEDDGDGDESEVGEDEDSDED